MTTPDIGRIAAVNHPLRRRLLELIHIDGPATASRLADITGQGVGNISHHLKVLAAADAIEEAPELAKDRRERWWRAKAIRMSWSIVDFADDPAAEMAAAAAEEANVANHVDKLRQWHQVREQHSTQWQRAAFSDESWLLATPAELVELHRGIDAVIVAFRDAPHDDDQEREHCFVFAHGVPARP